MEAFLAIFTLPIIFLNLLGGIVAGIWLIIIGEWGLVIWAVLFTILSTWIVSLLLMPGLLLALPLTWAIEKRKYFLLYIFGPLNIVWTYVVMTAWCVISFMYVLNNYESGSIWPYLLLGYTVATGPWTYMASKEGPDATGSIMGAFFCCLGGIVMMIVTLFSSSVNMLQLLICFGSVMLIAWIVQIIIFIFTLKAEKVKESNL